MPAQLISTTPIDSSVVWCRVTLQEDAADGRVHRGLQERLVRNHLARVFLSDSLAMGRASRTATSQWPTFARLSAASARSEEHTSELQSLMRISYAVFCLKKKKKKQRQHIHHTTTHTIHHSKYDQQPT